MPPSSGRPNHSVVPQKPHAHPAVRMALDALHVTRMSSPDPEAFDRLRREFWRAVSLISFDHSSPSTKQQYAGRDVRDWPFWLRKQIHKSFLLPLLGGVFEPTLSAVKKNARTAESLDRVVALFKTRHPFFLLDVGADIATSEQCLQSLVSLHAHNKNLTIDRISEALWAETLARLPNHEPPTPTTQELTEAMKKLDASFILPGSSAVSASQSAKPSDKRKSPTEYDDNKREDTNGTSDSETKDKSKETISKDMEQDGVERLKPKIGSTSKRARLDVSVDVPLLGHHLDNDLHAAAVDAGNGIENNKTALRLNILEQFVALGNPMAEVAGDGKGTLLQGVMASIYVVAKLALTQTGQTRADE